jgi:hypothetical protein
VIDWLAYGPFSALFYALVAGVIIAIAAIRIGRNP